MVVKIKKGKLFVRYKQRWVNIALEATAHGGGFKGYSRFIYHWIRCMFGIHRHGSFCGFTHDENGKITGFETYRACMYCHGQKKVDNGTYN